MSTSDVFSYDVDPREAGQRLDAYLAALLPECSRSRAASLIRRGFIRVDGEQCKPSHKVKSREQIVARIPVPEPVGLLAEPLPLEIIYEDRALIVINKQAGMVVHPGAGHSTGTLVHGILYHCPDLEGIGDEKRPGIVHRLDKETSGLLVVAKNAPTHANLSRQFKARTIQKQYLALIHGSPPGQSGKIDLPVGRHPVERKKMSTQGGRGRDALTFWKVLERFSGASLLEIDLKTGRTHQIRVHCQAMGYPIVGDQLYGRGGILKGLAAGNPALYQVLKKARRQMLHAFRLSFNHPASGQPLDFQAPLPEDMSAIIAQLRQIGQHTPLSPVIE